MTSKLIHAHREASRHLEAVALVRRRQAAVAAITAAAPGSTH